MMLMLMVSHDVDVDATWKGFFFWQLSIRFIIKINIRIRRGHGVFAGWVRWEEIRMIGILLVNLVRIFET